MNNPNDPTKRREITPNEIRILLGDLTPQERESFRKTEYWETCFQAWLDSEKPSLIKFWLAEPRETFLQYMDGKGVHYLKARDYWGMDEVDSLKFVFPRITGEGCEADEDEKELSASLRKKAESVLRQVQK